MITSRGRKRMLNYTKSCEARGRHRGQKEIIKRMGIFLAAICFVGPIFWSNAGAQQNTQITHGPMLGRLGASDFPDHAGSD